MNDDWLVWRYEASRPRLRGMAYRMLGSFIDADDAVQEAWIHVAGGDPDGVANLEGWFTTIVARVCLDMLRARKSRPETPVDVTAADVTAAAAAGGGPGGGGAGGPEQEAVLADTVGIALLVVLNTLAPAERVAFVLHEMFGVPFAEIASITGRSTAAARQLASRARRRIHGGTEASAGAGAAGAAVGASRSAAGADGAVEAADALGRQRSVARQRVVAEAFLAAAHGGDLSGLLAVLDPDVVLQSDAAASPGGRPLTIRGAQRVARAARTATVRSRYSDIALIDGLPGIVYAPRGRLAVVLAFRYAGDRISAIDVIADPARLSSLQLSLADG
jgi:RNA polymerase sigma factor (sigma-70 family)